MLPTVHHVMVLTFKLKPCSCLSLIGNGSPGELSKFPRPFPLQSKIVEALFLLSFSLYSTCSHPTPPFPPRTNRPLSPHTWGESSFRQLVVMLCLFSPLSPPLSSLFLSINATPCCIMHFPGECLTDMQATPVSETVLEVTTFFFRWNEENDNKILLYLHDCRQR